MDQDESHSERFVESDDVTEQQHMVEGAMRADMTGSPGVVEGGGDESSHM